MDLRQLEVFVSLAECRSFSQAAERLHLSQPTISTHLRTLEQELQARLIRRTTRVFALTPAGEKLYRHAVAMLAQRDEALRDVSGRQPDELLIGASSVPGQCLLPDILARFHRCAADVRLRVFCADSLEVISRVADASLDAGLVGTRTDAPCTFEPIATDELVFVAPNTPYYKALLHSNPPLETLLQEPLILRGERSGTTQEVERCLVARGIAPEALTVVARVDDAEILRRCVAQGLGASFLSRRLAEGWKGCARLLTFSIGEPKWSRSLYLVYRDDPYQPKALAELIRVIRDGCAAPER